MLTCAGTYRYQIVINVSEQGKLAILGFNTLYPKLKGAKYGPSLDAIF